ncbi:DNA processing protein Smf [Mycoplasmopsis maculosa]|uniref:DNA processing protein Smf n=1 Tax=Mycoplasmopsis maculosa TaxID=114885 RepID=A0A449B3D2_9BACT|nr:DNA-processing protein DprA [Mycoplasmopsis maculosa]VEU75097.1 DNA processing protein Smf [Mycoplasmopsis maculosa]
MNDILLFFSHLYKGNNYNIYKAIKDSEKVDIEKVENIKKELNENGIRYLTIYDEKYPKELKNLRYPPFVIYYKGNLDVLNKKKIILTGEKEDLVTKNNINSSIVKIAKEAVLITNNFKNLDQYIIKKYNELNKNVIYLLPCGIKYQNYEYNYEKDLLITQYPPNCHPKASFFKERNVIASSLADAIVIYNSSINSGIQNLANIAASLGKEVYCYPGFSYNDGNTFLIKSGARLITNIGEINYY